MATSAILNPASVPFFPGNSRGSGTNRTMNVAMEYHQDRSSFSSVSIPPSEFQSSKSSPSPSFTRIDGVCYSSSPGPLDGPPTFRRVDAGRPYPNIEPRAIKENNMLGTLESLPEADDTQENSLSLADNEPGEPGSGIRTPSSFMSPIQQQTRCVRSDVPPAAAALSDFSFEIGQCKSPSPESSLGSASQVGGSNAGNNGTVAADFDAQLKMSSFMHGLMDRIARCEHSTREIQHELTDIQRKVNILVERALITSPQQPVQPEFKDPFAVTTNGNIPGQSIWQPRPSVGNVAPNQQVPPIEDTQAITQRLNALTTSVGQLLALQTQQMQQTGLPHETRSSIIGLGPPQDVTPNQSMMSPTLSLPNLMGQTLSNRLDPKHTTRHASIPLRTWSSGTLDIPNRTSEPTMSRQEPILRDKSRRSVSGLLRRDSSGVLDAQGDYGIRDNGPIVTKWDQLQLAPELLRSLNKFGVGPPNKIQQRALPFLLKGADIIAQAPPTQERIAAYVIPAIQIAVTNMSVRTLQRGPIIIMVSTTVDQATQAQRMIRDLGGPVGIRSALGVGSTIATSDLTQEIRLLQQNIPHIICGTPQKLHALFTTPGGLTGSEVRFLVLDEVDQLIARNLHDFVFNIVKLLPPSRSGPAIANISNGGSLTNGLSSTFLDGGITSLGRRVSTIPTTSSQTDISGPVERQTALFSNTVPQDVLNLASAIHLKEPVRVLVRRDGSNVNLETTPGSRGLRQFYLYLAFTAGSRGDPAAATNGRGLGIIGSGRAGVTNAETAQAREWKLDALADLCDEIDVGQIIVHVGGMANLDAVVYKLASRCFDAVPLHADMNNGTKLAAINKFRTSAAAALMRQAPTRVLVVYDVQIKSTEVPHVPLVINYDLPKAVEGYAHRVVPAMAPSYGRAGVVINFVTATGGDVEMLRSIECHYKIKCPEVPLSPRDIFIN